MSHLARFWKNCLYLNSLTLQKRMVIVVSRHHVFLNVIELSWTCWLLLIFFFFICRPNDPIYRFQNTHSFDTKKNIYVRNGFTFFLNLFCSNLIYFFLVRRPEATGWFATVFGVRRGGEHLWSRIRLRREVRLRSNVPGRTRRSRNGQKIADRVSSRV